MKKISAAAANLSMYNMQNHFAVFNLPLEFNVDLDKLRHAYLELQKIYHPDRNRETDAYTAQELNTAYTVLKDKEQRAHHLLQLLDNGGELSIEQQSLQEVWQVLDDVEQCCQQSELEKLLAKQLKQKDLLMLQIESSFIMTDLAKVKSQLTELKYLNTIISHIKERISAIQSD